MSDPINHDGTLAEGTTLTICTEGLTPNARLRNKRTGEVTDPFACKVGDMIPVPPGWRVYDCEIVHMIERIDTPTVTIT